MNHHESTLADTGEGLSFFFPPWYVPHDADGEM